MKYLEVILSEAVILDKGEETCDFLLLYGSRKNCISLSCPSAEQFIDSANGAWMNIHKMKCDISMRYHIWSLLFHLFLSLWGGGSVMASRWATRKLGPADRKWVWGKQEVRLPGSCGIDARMACDGSINPTLTLSWENGAWCQPVSCKTVMDVHPSFAVLQPFKTIFAVGFFQLFWNWDQTLSIGKICDICTDCQTFYKYNSSWMF